MSTIDRLNDMISRGDENSASPEVAKAVSDTTPCATEPRRPPRRSCGSTMGFGRRPLSGAGTFLKTRQLN
jgi:hypothetical protein